MRSRWRRSVAGSGPCAGLTSGTRRGNGSTSTRAGGTSVDEADLIERTKIRAGPVPDGSFAAADRRELRLAELDAAVGDAAVRPALGDRDQAAGELADLEVVVRKHLVRHDDAHLVHLGLAVGA